MPALFSLVESNPKQAEAERDGREKVGEVPQCQLLVSRSDPNGAKIRVLYSQPTPSPSQEGIKIRACATQRVPLLGGVKGEFLQEGRITLS